MNRQYLKYALIFLAVIGTVVPYAAFVPFIVEHGLNLPLLIEQAGANRISAFAWLDILIAAMALILAAFSGSYIRLSHAILVALLTVIVGVSAGLPVFLYFSLVAVDKEAKVGLKNGTGE